MKSTYSRLQDPGQAQVSAPLVRGVEAVRPLAEEPGVPGQFEKVPEEGAREGQVPGHFLQRAVEIHHQVAAQVGKAVVIVDDGLLAPRVAERPVLRLPLGLRRGHLGIAEADLAVPCQASRRASSSP
jgi:hypothetical protein